MRVLVLSPGTRGDVAPATGLGAAFVADGHDVTIVANAEHAALVAAAECTLAPISAAVTPPAANADGDKQPGVRSYLATLRHYMDEAATAALAAAPGAEFIVTNAISPYGHDIAEGLQIPSVAALLQPWLPSAAYPPMIASAKELGRLGNRLAGGLARQVPAPYDPACARVRSELGLPRQSRRAGERRRRRQGLPVHHGISPAVLPRPRDWPAELSLDGFWQAPEPANWTPPPSLQEFLDAGPAPVVVSLGSMAAGPGVTRAVTEACVAADARFVLQGEDLRAVAERLDSSRVIHVDEVPHSWLLPQAAAVVHHAGAGMVSAVLRAGVPSVPMPSHTDQPFWARRLVALGAATDPIAMKRADGAALSAAVTAACTSRRLRDGARAVRDAMRGEDATAPLRDRLRELSA